jgi:hypothetical protein
MGNMYQKGLEQIVNGDIAWDTSSFKCMLVTSTYTYDPDHQDRADVTNEITNTGYTAGGNAVTTSAAAVDDANDQIEADATDVTFSTVSAGDQPHAAIVYLTTGVAANDILISYNVLTTPPAPNGGDYVIQWDAEGVFKIAAN